MPQKKYRHDGRRYRNVTITIAEDTLLVLNNAIAKGTDKNISSFIENAGLKFDGVTGRRSYGKSPVIRKSFTFSTDFIAKLNRAGNRSVALETAIIKKFKI